MNVPHQKPIALVTGGNAGIGFETCKKGLLDAGFHVVLCARTAPKAEAAIDELLSTAPDGGSAESMVLDLASLSSVREAAASFLKSGRSLSVCVLNAGIMALPWQQTTDGFEQQWQVNVLGHFLLCRLLLPSLQIATAPTGRIIHLSSGAHRRHPGPIDYQGLKHEHQSDDKFDRWVAYGRSKLANILFSNELARRQEIDSPVTSNALHPGLVATNLLTNAGVIEVVVFLSPKALVRPFIWQRRATDGQSGGYYIDCQPVTRGGARTEVSTSEDEGRLLWASACADLKLSESL